MRCTVCCVLFVVFTAVQCSDYNILKRRLNLLEQKQSRDSKELRDDITVLSSKLNTSVSFEKEDTMPQNQLMQSNLEYGTVQQSLVDVKEELGETRSMQETFFERFDTFLDSQTDSKGNLRLITEKLNSISEVTEDISQKFDNHADVLERPSQNHLWHTHGHSSYFIGMEVITWPEAVARCKELGAYLAQIDDSGEDNFLVDLARTAFEGSFTRGTWIGGSDVHAEGTWRWVHNEAKVTYFNWGAGEPNGNNRENCLHLFKLNEWKFSDAECYYHKMGYVCERDA